MSREAGIIKSEDENVELGICVYVYSALQSTYSGR